MNNKLVVVQNIVLVPVVAVFLVFWIFILHIIFKSKNTGWFVFALIFIPIGAILYYYLEYNKEILKISINKKERITRYIRGARIVLLIFFIILGIFFGYKGYNVMLTSEIENQLAIWFGLIVGLSIVLIGGVPYYIISRILLKYYTKPN